MAEGDSPVAVDVHTTTEVWPWLWKDLLQSRHAALELHATSSRSQTAEMSPVRAIQWKACGFKGNAPIAEMRLGALSRAPVTPPHPVGSREACRADKALHDRRRERSSMLHADEASWRVRELQWLAEMRGSV